MSFPLTMEILCQAPCYSYRYPNRNLLYSKVATLDPPTFLVTYAIFAKTLAQGRMYVVVEKRREKRWV